MLSSLFDDIIMQQIRGKNRSIQLLCEVCVQIHDVANLTYLEHWGSIRCSLLIACQDIFRIKSVHCVG